MLNYRLFQLRLLTHLAKLAFRSGLATLKKRASFVVVAVLFAISVGLLLNQVVTTPVRVRESATAQAPGSIIDELSAEITREQLTEPELNNRLNRVEQLLQEQPTHFDLLVNAALLHQAKGNQATAETYFERARAVNPNHPIFQ